MRIEAQQGAQNRGGIDPSRPLRHGGDSVACGPYRFFLTVPGDKMSVFFALPGGQRCIPMILLELFTDY